MVFVFTVTILAMENMPIWIRYSAGEGSPIAERLRVGPRRRSPVGVPVRDVRVISTGAGPAGL